MRQRVSYKAYRNRSGRRRMKMSTNVPHDVFDPHAGDTVEGGPFVLNLCTVHSPLAVPQPRTRHRAKHAFFVSRGLEGDHERFWLHMGYFDTRDEAEEWLELLHPSYPLAFVTSAAVTFVPD